MTIKQNGGIFGRNPTFNDVTIEGELTFEGDIDVNSDLKVSGDIDVSGDVIVNSRTYYGIAGFWDNAVNGNNKGLRIGGAGLYPTDGNGNPTTGVLDIGTTSRKFNDVHLAGNVIVSSGSGIDFSATSGTGTSELFDDYEEGTFNLSYTTTGTPFDSVTMDATRTKGRYVKIGRVVHVQCTLRSDAITIGSASGDVLLSGFPFSFPANSSGTGDGYAAFAVGFCSAFGSNNPINVVGKPGDQTAYLVYRTTAISTATLLAPSDMATGANANSITFSGTYYT